MQPLRPVTYILFITILSDCELNILLKPEASVWQEGSLLYKNSTLLIHNAPAFAFLLQGHSNWRNIDPWTREAQIPATSEHLTIINHLIIRWVRASTNMIHEFESMFQIWETNFSRPTSLHDNHNKHHPSPERIELVCINFPMVFKLWPVDAHHKLTLLYRTHRDEAKG